MQQHVAASRPAATAGPGDRSGLTADALHARTQSSAYARALDQLRRYAPLDGVPVLIEGETGTGKTWFARTLHAASARARRPYYHVNLAALEDSLASSDLFGHLSGAFTGANQRRAGWFASADGGTLFLDEVGQASLAIQRKLLHTIEYGEVWPVGADRAIRVDVRIVAATNRPAAALVQEGTMLHDLLPRLAAFRIRIPPLRERREDIAPLARALVERDAARYGGYATPPALAPELVRRLEREPWSGNVRQLEGVMRRLVVDACGERTLATSLLDEALDDTVPSSASAPVRDPLRTDVQVDIDSAVREGVPKAELARQLGISRATLYRRMARADAAPEPETIDVPCYSPMVSPASSQRLSHETPCDAP